LTATFKSVIVSLSESVIDFDAVLRSLIDTALPVEV
jgi:hypothetical protein